MIVPPGDKLQTDPVSTKARDVLWRHQGPWLTRINFNPSKDK